MPLRAPGRRTAALAGLAAFTALGAAAPRVANAQETPAAETPEPTIRVDAGWRRAVGVNLGVGSAVGLGGVTLTQELGDHFRVEAGGGFGVSGWQLSLMPKLVLGSGRDRYVAGAGVSIAFPTDSRSATGRPIWLNVDVLGYEHRFDSGLALSAALGLTGGLGGGQLCVPSDGCEPQLLHDVTTYWGPQTRIGVAYWF